MMSEPDLGVGEKKTIWHITRGGETGDLFYLLLLVWCTGSAGGTIISLLFLVVWKSSSGDEW